MEKLKKRWGITSDWQFFVILLVFTLTGFSASFISKPFLALFGIYKETTSLWVYYPLYIVLIFPFYQIMLVSYGFIFGQHTFFWSFEKKMLRGMKLGFIADFLEQKKRN